MNSAIRKLLTAAWLLLGCQVAAAQAEHEQAGQVSEDASIEQILQALESRGEQLNDFVADLSMEEMDNTTGDAKIRTGRIWYERRDEGAVRMRILFENKVLDGRVMPEKIEYLLKDGWLTDRSYDRKIEINRQVLRPGEKVDLLKLGEGPFPLPIGQDPKDVVSQFEVEKLSPGEDAPANSVHVQLTPRAGTDLSRRFSTLDFWIDSASHMPVRIVTMDQNLAGVQTTVLTNLEVNEGIEDEHFVLEDVSDQGWTRRDEPFDR